MFLFVCCEHSLHLSARAERRLIDTWTEKARKKGVPQHSVIPWVRRKFPGRPEIVVWRLTSSGDLACSLPCLLCRKQLIKFGFRVTCHTGTVQGVDVWYSGTLTEVSAPVSTLTTRQRLTLTKHK